MSSDWKSWLVGALVAASAVVPAALQQPTFRSGVELITVDAAVLDREGRPVPALAAADFRIEVDGRPRRVVSAQFVDQAAPLNPPIGPAPSHFSTNAGLDDGRVIVVAVDEAHIRRLEGRSALAAAARFIDRLPATDRVGVIGLTSASGFTLTRDRAALRTKLETLLGNGDALSGQFNLGISEALEIADGGRVRLAEAVLRECGRALTEYVSAARAVDDATGRDSCPEQLEQESRGIAQHAHAQARISLAALEALVARLKQLPGPKTVVLLSEGMIVDARRADLSRLAADAQAARVTIYALLLETPLFDAAQERMSPSDTRDRQVRHDGIDRIAGAARGAVFRLVGGDAAPFARVARELSGHYLLAFEAADSDRDARIHRIRVTVDRGGASVRARTHFVVPATTPTARGAQLSALLRTAAPASELPLHVATYSYAEPARQALRLVISAETGSGGGGVPAWLGFVLIDANGVIAATASAESSSGRYAFSCVVPDGRYTLRAAAIDSLGRQGTVQRAFHARLAGTGQVRVADLMLAPVPAAPAEPLSPIVDRASGDAVVGYLEFRAEASARPAEVRFDVLRSLDAAPLVSAPAKVSLRDDGWSTARAVIPIGALASGTYVARAEIASTGAPVGGVTRTFTIAR